LVSGHKGRSAFPSANNCQSQLQNYLTPTKHDCTSVSCIINWNPLVSGHKGRSAFPSANNCQGQLQNYLTRAKHDCTSVSYIITGIHRLVVIKDGRLSPAQTTAKVNCKIISPHKTRLHFSLMYCYWNPSVSGHKGRSAFPSANNCQGQLQTPRSVSVGTICFSVQ